MPRRPEQYEQLRAATRENVLTAAVRLFARHGFAATSMRQIAATAGISTGLIYRHYATKEQLFDDLLTQAVEGLAELVRALRAEADPVEILRSATDLILSGLAADDGSAEFYMVMNQGFTTDDPPGTADRLAREHGELWRATAELVERGQQQGRFAGGDPDQLATCYFATLSGLVTMRLAQGSALEIPPADVVVRSITGGRDEH